ncbi:MAG: GxxExxY protein [Pseudomonadota bacterium]
MAVKGDKNSYRIIGAAMEVHRELGFGFLEQVYQEALEREFSLQDIPFTPQPQIQILYKDSPLTKTYQPDFICYDSIIVEIKAIQKLSGTEESQVINYLKASGYGVGLLINFGTKSLQYKRLVF